MSAIETQVDGSFVGLENAETRLPADWANAQAKVVNLGVMSILGVTQLGWVAALGYFAYTRS